MKMVEGIFVCTEKEKKDLAVVDKMFRITCRSLACSECPFQNKREKCTAALFFGKIIKRTKSEKRSST